MGLVEGVYFGDVGRNRCTDSLTSYLRLVNTAGKWVIR